MTTQREEYETLIERAKRIIVEEYDVDKMARAIIAEAASTLGPVTERMVTAAHDVPDTGDNADLFTAMLAASPITPGGETKAQHPPHSFPTASREQTEPNAAP